MEQVKNQLSGENLKNLYKKFNKVYSSLGAIGKSEKLRGRFIELCRDVEESIVLEGQSVRDEITGPLVDALHSEIEVLKKSVKPGLIFNYKYTSKISRELAMSPDSEPDHVWEPQTTKLLLHFSKNAEHVLIGGAYFGDQAVIVAKSMEKDGGTCHAFEANLDLFGMLQVNAKNNQLGNLKLNHIGLWEDCNKKLKLVGEDDASAHPQLANSDESDNDAIATISINNYGEQHTIKKFDFIMLDIEGGELSALKGADDYLSQPESQAPVLVFEVHRHYCDWSNGLERTDIVKFLKGFGYHVFSVRDYQNHVSMKNRPIELIPPERTFLEGPAHGFNMLAVKDVELINNDLFRICYDVSPKLLKHKDSNLHHPKY